MNHSALTAKDAPSLESIHKVKLEALLNDLVRRERKIRAARSLRVNYKTVAEASNRDGCRCTCGRRS